MPYYGLPKHVYFCGRGDSFVFLDLHKDEYIMIKGQQAAAFRQSILDKNSSHSEMDPISSPAGYAAIDSAQDNSLSELLANELLIPAEDGKAVTAADVETPTESLTFDDSDQRSRLRVQQLWFLFISFVKAALWLRFLKIERIVMSVKRRKELKKPAHPTDMNTTRHLVTAFLRFRSLFPANYLCLFDSLALIEFLAHYGSFPTWVFGVRFEIWGAHCWVQEGNVLLNEDVDEAEEYVPIMSI